VFGLNEALMSFIRRQVGLRTDVASANGSLHGKVGDLKEYVYTNRNILLDALQKPRGATVSGSMTVNTVNSWITVLDITGKGCLTAFAMQKNSSQYAMYNIKVDGVTVYLGSIANTTPEVLACPLKNFNFNKGPHTETLGAEGVPERARASFKSSLKIEINIIDNGNATAYWNYEKE
jgi:hypothetical protein